MQTNFDTITKLVDVSREKYGDYSYAAGYFGSLASSMIFEMRTRGGKDMTEMADYYDRMIRTSIKNIQEDK